MSDRIYGDKIKIDYDKTLDFFENRGNNKELNTKYNYVLFQDDSPSIAIARDNEEKNLKLTFIQRVIQRKYLSLKITEL